MASKRVLVVYYSLTEQTERVIKRAVTCLEDAGHSVDIRKLEPREPWKFPVGRRIFLWRNALCWAGMDMNMPVHPIDLKAEDYDHIVFGLQTWHLFPSFPMNFFLESDMGDVMRGKTVSVILTCRNRYKNVLEILKQRFAFKGGNWVSTYVLVNPPNHMLPTLYYLFNADDPEPGSYFDEKSSRPFAFSDEDVATVDAFACNLAHQLSEDTLPETHQLTVVNDQGQ